MKKRISLVLSITLLLGLSDSLYGQGYYKDIFMDGGIRLTSRKDLPAARRLGLSIEHFITGRGTEKSPLTLQDTIMQTQIMVGSEIDYNGVLLYPDGQPRFKVIYVNGGRATQHGVSLGKKGRDNIRQFVKSGGSYVGTCAGMFLATNGIVPEEGGAEERKPGYKRDGYLHIWPGMTHYTRLAKTPTDIYIEPGSPLLRYFDFGGDMHIKDVYHNGGGYAYEPTGLPRGTEILARYDYEPKTRKGGSINHKINTWAYKESDETGRIVLTGSHPEAVTTGDRLDFMAAMILYAIDGLGDPVIKGELRKGEVREMTKSTEDYDPNYTKIGDKQYHHFTVEIPAGAKNVTVELVGPSEFDLNLYMRRGTPAFIDGAEIIDIKKGAEKTIKEKSLEHGTWFIAVECDTTVDTVLTKWGEAYTGNLSVLNGVPYTIKVDWD